MTDFYSSCSQCPRNCLVNRNEKSGFCGEKKEIRAAVACLHFGEEPLITVYGGSGTIFFTGCTLRCSFCQNYQISQNGMGRALSKDEFIKICLDLQNAGAENINLVTASHVIPLLAEYLKAARDAGVTVPYCWNSSAYESVESLELLKGLVTVWLPDLKTLNSEVSKKLFGAADYPEVATKAIKWMIKNNPLKIETVNGIEKPHVLGDTDCLKDGGEKNSTKEKMMSGVIVRHLFLPGRFEDTAETLSWLKENADTKAVISLMSQYTPVPFKEDDEKLAKRKEALSVIENRLVTDEEDQDLRDLIDAYDFDYLFYQDLCADTEWLPDFTRPQPFSNALAKVLWHF
ncbi:MAG: radical SAM protein [Treponema sp.]|nr:radical SAM protein [Candidatus Treponema merdequi]